MPTSRAELLSRLPELMSRDEHRLRRRVDAARRIRDDDERQAALDGIAADVDAARQRVAQRRAAIPEIRYPKLPIAERRDEIAAAIGQHQVVVVTGETGSGKTTQLPKICLELGRGVRGAIGHTQPRRLAARTVAERIAEELRVDLGEIVGWKVRFTDRASKQPMVKVMTDGILLTEIQHDRQLRQYDTIIVDEAHERSLNIDFILGYLKRLLPQRPDLKVIVTSATIDPQRFAAHFDQAPIIEVSGRSYPVEVRYRPIDADDDRDQIQAICDAVDELSGEVFGDVLVFLSGEREIRDTADALRRQQRPETEILPLYARLSAAEQHRVFAPHTGRRIVLATNVAETSLTVPGIRYVIDPGTARISRYSRRLKVQRLPIEPVSKASANQRAGRCGRLADGICIRLYAEADYDNRPEFTEPEIQRTNLASVLLQMAALGLGEVVDFPFVDPPDRRQIADGRQLLEELGALDGNGRLTDVGRALAQLPIDPRIGRMVVEADRNGCLQELLVIAAALSIQDPRERPADAEQAADAKHARFADPASDFLAYLNLWNALQEQQRELSSSAFRRMCRTDYLHYLRVREWQDLHGQLQQITRGLGMTPNTAAATPAHVHGALLAGLLSHIGLFDPESRDYGGARGARFAIFPGSTLFRKPPRWVMAAELVETTRLWARTCARIEPDWIEPLAMHLVKRSYSEPHWERRRGAVVALERVTLYGIPIVTARKVNYSAIDPALCRELFIRHALVDGDWETRHAFFQHNRELLEDVEELEHRARRRDILVDEQTLFDFYDERIPESVVSARHFDSWWRTERRERPELLTYTPQLLIAPHAAEISEHDFPDQWPVGELRLPLTYQFEPGSAADGVTVHIPLAVLNRLLATQLETGQFDWQVPGLREELVIALLRSLPKQLRQALVPVPDTARAVLSRVTPYTEPLLELLSRELGVPRDAWDLDRVPDHLKITFRVVGNDGEELASGKDLPAVAEKLRPTVQATVAAVVGTGIERDGLRSFDFDAVPRIVHRRHGDHILTGYPALVDSGDSVAVRVMATEADQRRAMWRGTRRLLLLNVPSPVKLIQRSLDNQVKLALSTNPHGSVAAMLTDCIDCAADAIITEHGGPAWDRAGFESLRRATTAELGSVVLTVLADVSQILAGWRSVRLRLGSLTAPAMAASVADMRAQLDALVYPGFVTATGRRRLPDIARYLRAVERRLDGLERVGWEGRLARDQDWMRQVHAVQSEYERLRCELPATGQLDEIRWMLEELRVSLFAQTIGTAYPISEKRIRRAMDKAIE